MQFLRQVQCTQGSGEALTPPFPEQVIAQAESKNEAGGLWGKLVGAATGPCCTAPHHAGQQNSTHGWALQRHVCPAVYHPLPPFPSPPQAAP